MKSKRQALTWVDFRDTPGETPANMYGMVHFWDGHPYLSGCTHEICLVLVSSMSIPKYRINKWISDLTAMDVDVSVCCMFIFIMPCAKECGTRKKNVCNCQQFWRWRKKNHKSAHYYCKWSYSVCSLASGRVASQTDVLRFVTRSSPRTSAQWTNHFCLRAVSQS